MFKMLTAYIEDIAEGIYRFFRTTRTKRFIYILVPVCLLTQETISKFLLEQFSITPEFPRTYNYYYWSIVAILFICAVLFRVKEKKVTFSEESLAGDSMIKGLLAFQFNDSTLFKKLQRQTEVANWKSAIMQRSFRFGIITADSGTGKTSLIQAGLFPSLKDDGANPVVVTLTNQELSVVIKDTLANTFGINGDEIDDWKQLLQKIISESPGTSFILFFDQFEQLFTQHTTDNNAFVFFSDLRILLDRYKQLKIIISIRSDFISFILEYQPTLSFILQNGINYFHLRKFTSMQAAAIFKSMSENENMDDADVVFLERFCRSSLAGSDGLISPVDIQITALVVRTRKDLNGSFNEHTFQKLGGIQGLMKSYIQDHLSIPNYFNKKNNILSVLLALINREKHVRSGRLTIGFIQQNNVTGEPIAHIEDILAWLSNAKLVSIHAGEETEYELAHEQMIEPILQLYFASDIAELKLNALLERRSQEWFVNQKNSRYLLSPAEIIQVLRNKKAINWSPQSIIKSDFWRVSKLRILRQLLFVSGLLILLVGGYFLFDSSYYKMNVRLPNYTTTLYEKYLEPTDKLRFIDSAAALDLNLLMKFEKESFAPIDIGHLRRYFLAHPEKILDSIEVNMVDSIAVDGSGHFDFYLMQIRRCKAQNIKPPAFMVNRVIPYLLTYFEFSNPLIHASAVAEIIMDMDQSQLRRTESLTDSLRIDVINHLSSSYYSRDRLTYVICLLAIIHQQLHSGKEDKYWSAALNNLDSVRAQSGFIYQSTEASPEHLMMASWMSPASVYTKQIIDSIRNKLVMPYTLGQYLPLLSAIMNKYPKDAELVSKITANVALHIAHENSRVMRISEPDLQPILNFIDNVRPKFPKEANFLWSDVQKGEYWKHWVYNLDHIDLAIDRLSKLSTTALQKQNAIRRLSDNMPSDSRDVKAAVFFFLAAKINEFDHTLAQEIANKGFEILRANPLQMFSNCVNILSKKVSYPKNWIDTLFNYATHCDVINYAEQDVSRSAGEFIKLCIKYKQPDQADTLLTFNKKLIPHAQYRDRDGYRAIVVNSLAAKKKFGRAFDELQRINNRNYAALASLKLLHDWRSKDQKGTK